MSKPYRPIKADLKGKGLRSHALLLVAALLLLQFPQFISGTVAIITFAGFLALSVLAWPRVRIIYGPLAALVALMAVSILWSESFAYSAAATFSAFIIVSAGLAVGAALPLETALKVMHRATVAIGAASLAMGVALPGVGLHDGPDYVGTLIGPYISKNALATVIMFGVLAMLFRQWGPGRGARSVLVSLAVYVPVLVWTESATTLAILAIGVGFRMVYGWWIRVHARTKAAAIGLFLAPAVLLGAFAWSIYNGVLTLLDRDVTLTGRTGIWDASLAAWATKPWLGVGWGSFEVDSTVSYYQFMHYGWIRNHAHSGYIQVLTELGIIGATLLLVVLIVVLVRVVRAARQSPTMNNGWLIAAFIAFVAHNVAEQSMRLLPLFIIALVYGACTRQRADRATKTRAPHPVKGGARSHMV